MEPVHVTESELAQDLQGILRRVETGVEVVVERNSNPTVVIRAALPVRRKISECIARMPAGSPGTIDTDFASDVQAAISAHREALEPLISG